MVALSRIAMIAAHRLNQPIPIGLTHPARDPVTAPAPSSSGLFIPGAAQLSSNTSSLARNCGVTNPLIFCSSTARPGGRW